MSERGGDLLWQDASYAPSLAAAPLQTVDSKRRGTLPEVATGAPVMLAAAAPTVAPEPEADVRAPGPWIAEAMSTALDKYQGLARDRLGAGREIDAAY